MEQHTPVADAAAEMTRDAGKAKRGGMLAALMKQFGGQVPLLPGQGGHGRTVELREMKLAPLEALPAGPSRDRRLHGKDRIRARRATNARVAAGEW